MRLLTLISSISICTLLSSCTLITVPVKIVGKTATTTVGLAGKIARTGVGLVTPNSHDDEDLEE